MNLLYELYYVMMVDINQSSFYWVETCRRIIFFLEVAKSRMIDYYSLNKRYISDIFFIL